jgi:hypothetical protein
MRSEVCRAALLRRMENLIPIKRLSYCSQTITGRSYGDIQELDEAAYRRVVFMTARIWEIAGYHSEQRHVFGDILNLFNTEFQIELTER